VTLFLRYPSTTLGITLKNKAPCEAQPLYAMRTPKSNFDKHMLQRIVEAGND